MSETETNVIDEKEMEAQLQQDTEAWRGVAGEYLIGTVVNVERRSSAFGAYPAVTVRKNDGTELVFHAFRTVAKNELSRCRPVIGDQIGILYKGQEKGKDFHGYRIRLNRLTAQNDFNWNEFDGDGKPPTSSDDDVPF